MHPRFIDSDVWWSWGKVKMVRRKSFSKQITTFEYVKRGAVVGGYSFPIYFVIKRVTHKVLCVQPHHQTRWSYVSASKTTQAKPTGWKKGNFLRKKERRRWERKILLVWSVNKMKKKEGKNKGKKTIEQVSLCELKLREREYVRVHRKIIPFYRVENEHEVWWCKSFGFIKISIIHNL